MKICTQCRHEILLQEPPAKFCPQCGQALTAAGPQSAWKPIARLNNLAETGYFADLLEGNDIPTNVVQRNDYNALDGSWETVFVLQVPVDRAAEAAETMRRELAEGEHGEDYWDAPGASRRSPASMWKPVALVLVAGGLAYCAGRSGLDRPPVTAPKDKELWQALSEAPDPLVVESRDGLLHRRVTIEPDAETISVDDDFDGDRRWDRRRIFKDGRLIDEVVH